MGSNITIVVQFRSFHGNFHFVPKMKPIILVGPPLTRVNHRSTKCFALQNESELKIALHEVSSYREFMALINAHNDNRACDVVAFKGHAHYQQ